MMHPGGGPPFIGRPPRGPGPRFPHHHGPHPPPGPFMPGILHSRCHCVQKGCIVGQLYALFIPIYKSLAGHPMDGPPHMGPHGMPMGHMPRFGPHGGPGGPPFHHHFDRHPHDMPHMNMPPFPTYGVKNYLHLPFCFPFT